MRKLLIFTSLIGIIYAKPFFTVSEGCQGYNACAPIDLNKLNVHLIPHSHDDVGWLSTVDQYFYDQVETIISSVVGSLLQNEDRRFIQVETAFFKKWWVQQNELTKNFVRQLVNEGRLEFIGGGWSMNDEAVAHYQAMIDQMTLGMAYLKDNVGKCALPKIGWQIDPFGHSREQASIFSQLGFDGFYFGRLDYRDRDKRKSEGNMDLLWTGSANLGSDSNIFTSIFESHYASPSGFCFDVRCSDELVVAEEESPEYNLENRVNDFVDVINKVKDHYPTDNVLFTMGDDFKWESAERSFNNVDKLINGFKKINPTIDGKEINIFYSTPSCYAKAVNQFVIENKMTLDVKTDDFFPYATSGNTQWAGFFTSRPTSKRYERMSNNFLQVARQLTTLGKIEKEALFPLESAMGIMQHHDAVTGTEKVHVEKDYHRVVAIGIEKTTEVVGRALTNILGSAEDIRIKGCPLNNVSICAETNKDEFDVLIYNPLAKSVSHYIQLAVSGDSWEVTDPDGKTLVVAVSEPIRDFSYVTKVTGDSLHTNVLIFKADLPALGYNVYKVKKGNQLTKQSKVEELKLGADTQIGFDDRFVVLDGTTGRLKSITLNGASVDVDQDILWYNSSSDSGTYIFRPEPTDRDAHTFGKTVENTILTNSGDVREIKQVWNDWITQIIRVYKDEDFIEIDYAVGPIDLEDKLGKEIVLRYSTSIASNGVFYTDSNGRELIQRKKDYFPTFNYTNDEPQAGNYYPITSRIAIEDDTNRFAVLTDRSHGGSSLGDGQIEIMVNRALTHDDGYGESLNEQEYDQGLVSRGSHYITLGAIKREDKSVAAIERQIALRKLLQPAVFFTQNIEASSDTFITKELPENVHLLTLTPWNDQENQLLIRLEHIFELNDDATLSQDATVDLTVFFKHFTISTLEETLLAGTVLLSDSERLTWPQVQKSLEPSILDKEVRLQRQVTDLKITLAPMQIRTFIATIVRK